MAASTAADFHAVVLVTRRGKHGSACQHVEPDDFVIHLRSFQGGIEHSAHQGKVSNAYTAFAPVGAAEPRYFRWVPKSYGLIQELPTTTQSIKFEQFADIALPRPPVDGAAAYC